jgi:hypothetical protein
VACDQFRFERLDIDVSGAADVADAVDLLCIAADGIASAAGQRPVLLRARLVGPTQAHEHLVDERADLVDVVRAVRPELMGDGELLRIDIATSPAVDRTQLLDRGDLLAALLQRLDTIRALDDAQLHGEVSHSADLVDAATRGIFAELCGLDPSVLRRVVDDVERRFLDALVERS